MFLTKDQLYHKIDDCRCMLHYYGIKEPITLEKICSTFANVEVSYLPFKTHGLRGMVSLANQNSPLNCILISSLLPQEEQLFHGIHEFMHVYLHSDTENRVFRCYDNIRSAQDTALEWQANEGTAELLMPYKSFIPTFCELLKVYRDNQDFWDVIYGNTISVINVLAKKYNLSGKVIENRISSLSYEIDQFHNGIPIDRIQVLSYTKQKIYGIATTDYVQQIEQLSCQRFFELSWDAVIC